MVMKFPNRFYRVRYSNASGDSEADAEGEPETENEDYVEPEGEESQIGDTSQTDLPKFRDLVRAKKSELKSQYGKAHIEKTTREVCTNVPYTTWDSNINCASVCVKWNYKLECTERATKCLGGFTGGTNRQCVNVPHFAWVSGWRKKWREYKRDGGLVELKMMSKGLLPLDSQQPPTLEPTPQANATPFLTPTPFGVSQVDNTSINAPSNVDTSMYDDMTCQELSNEFGIISGQTFGSANEGARQSWVKRGCNTKPIQNEEKSSESQRQGQKGEESDKILGMPRNVAIGVGVAVLAVGTFAIIKKIMK
jgi:hypothetical protein